MSILTLLSQTTPPPALVTVTLHSTGQDYHGTHHGTGQEYHGPFISPLTLALLTLNLPLTVGRRLQQKGPGAAAATVADVTLLTLSISETTGGTTTTLPTTTLKRPCYLVDLQGVENVPTGALNLNGGGRVVTWDGQGTSMTYANVHANSGTMASWAALTEWTAGMCSPNPSDTSLAPT